jgi:hypothetical protein
MTLPSLWGRKDSPLAFSAYTLNDYQQFLTATLKELVHKDNLFRFLDNRGYLSGLVKLLDFFPLSFLEQNDSKTFNELFMPLKQVAIEHAKTGLLPTEITWNSIIKTIEPFSTVSISITPAEFLSGVQHIIETISKLVEEDNKVAHIEAFGIITALKSTGYFNYQDPLSKHIALLSKALDNFATNPCPDFDPILKKPVIEELKRISESIPK